MRDFASCYSDHAVKVSDASCSASSSGSSNGGNSSLQNPSIQSSVTCLYRTKLSTQKELSIRITWSKTLIGQGLSVAIDDDSPGNRPSRLPLGGNLTGSNSPLILRKKKGSHSYVSGDSVIGLYWDISSAKYGSGPEPIQDFCLVVVMDAEIGLLVGDMCGEQVKKFEREIMSTAEFAMVGRREQLLGNGVYSTTARFGEEGKDHEILIRCKDSELLVCVDGKRVVQVRRLRWNFRGNQIVFVDGMAVDLMWDVHDWSFGGGKSSGGAAFMFRTRSAPESRLWMEEESTHTREQGKPSTFSVLIHAFKKP